MTKTPLVSIVIPCYNHARFLAAAITSAIEQSYAPCEILVVDDGSSDDSAQIAGRYSSVKLIRQRNAGLAAARNAGVAACSGSYITFLDADDRLLPDAVAIGVISLNLHRVSAFVFGRYRLIDGRGLPLDASPRLLPYRHQYLDLLRHNYIGLHATVMYRRDVLHDVGGFDESLKACEDYDLFLRITRRFQIHCHDQLVAEYRQHETNMSSNAALMLKSSLRVLRAQRTFLRSDEAREAYGKGVRNWQDYYGNRLMKNLRLRASERQWKLLFAETCALIRHYPRGIKSKLHDRIMCLAASSIAALRSKRTREENATANSRLILPSQESKYETRS
jgi:glycosyltransferase involved in cell wall biosynthesis